MMNPPTQQQVVLGNHQYPSVAPVILANPNRPLENLWGANARRITGIFQIICGGIALALGIAVIFVDYDRVGWGVWNGGFAVVTGFLGVFSLREKCMVIAYMITSIITAVLCVPCCFYAGILIAFSYFSARELYIVLLIVFFAQMVVSIVGASFTCGALSSSNNQPQQVVYYTPQPLPQQYIQSPPFTVVTSQNDPPPYTATSSVNGAYVSGKV